LAYETFFPQITVADAANWTGAGKIKNERPLRPLFRALTQRIKTFACSGKEESRMSPFFTPSRKKVLFFDMNNTLVDRRQCFHSGFLEVLGEYTARWDVGEKDWTVEDALHSYKAEWSKRRKQQGKETLSSDELRYACLKKALEPYPIRVSEAFSKSFFHQVEEAEESYVSLFPDVLDTLDKLSKQYRLAIISNGKRDRLERNLEMLQLSRYIPKERLFSSEKDGPRKPHPALFERALQSLETTPQQSIMIGNSWKQDIVGATKCGLDAVWIHPASLKKISQRMLGRQKVVIIRACKQLLNIL
jgi:HAD superfamily hydrolase (TIGR01549 family)